MLTSLGWMTLIQTQQEGLCWCVAAWDGCCFGSIRQESWGLARKLFKLTAFFLYQHSVQLTFVYTLISFCNNLPILSSSLTEHDTRVTAKERQKKDNHNLSKRAFALAYLTLMFCLETQRPGKFLRESVVNKNAQKMTLIFVVCFLRDSNWLQNWSKVSIFHITVTFLKNACLIEGSNFQ